MTELKKKLSYADIVAEIAAEYYFDTLNACVLDNQVRPCDVDGLATTTICILVLKNGYRITGESHCVDKTTYNEADGKKYAKEQAIEKLWPILGYELKTKIIEANQAKPSLHPALNNNLANQQVIDHEAAMEYFNRHKQEE